VNLTLSVEAKDSNLPPLKVHPLPISLQNWTSDNQDNYFSEIEPHLAGYLIWSSFPIKVIKKRINIDLNLILIICLISPPAPKFGG
jgi:predicted Zn-dependent protease